MLPETQEEREQRQRFTGEVGDGKMVSCSPFPEEPGVIRIQSRAVCLYQRYPACATCQHGTFTLLFDANTQRRLELVSCPKWGTPWSRVVSNASPDLYVPTEIATCEESPFEFCPSCPSRAELAEIDLDKGQPGWFGRWRRIMEDESDE